MPTITVKNIPEDLYDRLRQVAQANRRSINSEVIVCIEKAVGTRKIDIEAELAQAKRLRELTAHYWITDDEINEAKANGRP